MIARPNSLVLPRFLTTWLAALSTHTKSRMPFFEYNRLRMKSTQTFVDFQTEFLHLATAARIPEANWRRDLSSRVTTQLQQQVLAVLPDLTTYERLADRLMAIDSGSRRINARMDNRKK